MFSFLRRCRGASAAYKDSDRQGGTDVPGNRKKDRLKKMAYPAVSAANFLLVQEIGDMLLGMVPMAARVAPRVAMAPAGVAKVSVAATPGVSVPSYSNGKHIFVD